MATQLSKGRAFDLSDLDGQLIPWRQAAQQPHLIDIEGQLFVPIFADEAALNAVMTSLGVTGYTIKQIDEGYDFISSRIEAGVKACFNVRFMGVGKPLRYTEIRIDGKP